MFFEPSFTLEVRPHEIIGEDWGSPVYGHGEPFDWPVFSWAVSATDEPKVVGRDRTVVDVEVFAPTAPVDHRDLVALPDGDYQVEGLPEDYTHSPHGFGDRKSTRLNSSHVKISYA